MWGEGKVIFLRNGGRGSSIVSRSVTEEGLGSGKRQIWCYSTGERLLSKIIASVIKMILHKWPSCLKRI